MPLELVPVVGARDNIEQSPLRRSNDRKAGLFRHGQPAAHWFVRTKKFVAFLWQIAPIVPVLPTAPVYKPFAVNKMLAKRYLDTIKVERRKPALALVKGCVDTS